MVMQKNTEDLKLIPVIVPVSLRLAARIKSAKTGIPVGKYLREKLAEWVSEREQPADDKPTKKGK